MPIGPAIEVDDICGFFCTEVTDTDANAPRGRGFFVFFRSWDDPGYAAIFPDSGGNPRGGFATFLACRCDDDDDDDAF